MKKRVHEIAKEMGLTSSDVINKLKELGVSLKSHNSSVNEEDEEKLKKSTHKKPGTISAAVSAQNTANVTPQKPKTILRKKKEAATEETAVTERKIDAEPAIQGSMTFESLTAVKQHGQEEVSSSNREEVPENVKHEVTIEHHVDHDEIQPKTAVSESAVTEDKMVEIKDDSTISVLPRDNDVTLQTQSGLNQDTSVTGRNEGTEAGINDGYKTIKGKIKSEKGGIFIKRKLLSRSEPDIAEEIKLLDEPVELTPEPLPEVIPVKEYGQKGQSKRRDSQSKKMQQQHTIKKAKEILKQPKAINIERSITVSNLSQLMGIKATEIIKRLITLGIMANINDIIDADTASLIVKDMGFDVSIKQEISPEDVFKNETDAPEKSKPRPPVVTVMGHVDHGKTTLLDAIRSTNVAGGEAGGITQSIGAYKVTIDNKQVTFLDTPGHEAFTAMRARGAKVTDLVILVVAADDGAMPQTLEAIDHANAASVPIIVAINKIDKPEAQPQKVMQQLSDKGLVPEQWGGNTLFAMISAKNKKGINELLELILLQAEIMELKANPDKNAKGIIIETRMDKGLGVIVSAIIREGTIKKGNYVVYGNNYNKVRALLDEKGNIMAYAAPSTPVEIIGFDSFPEVGETIFSVDDEDTAKKIVEYRKQQHQVIQPAKKIKITLEDIYKKIEEGSIKELKIILKCDSIGSLGAIKDAIDGFSRENVKIKIIHSSIGSITESDVMLASASDGIIIGFNVRPDSKASHIASLQNVEIKTYNIIYDLIDDMKKALVGMLEPVVKEKILGRAKIIDTFKVSKVGTVAGCIVTEGKIERGANARILREGVVVYDSKIGSLKRFKEDAKNVDKGMECGVGIANFNDIKKGDELEVYRLEQVAKS
ncbi:MAG: translation initiation factor IF-2 [Deltaproteobacteria bacterium]|nr:translation initiation factor IF-2 [Deltaproteobacteria bacterium]MCL5792994.1 translation initiation factor IF-2 [Deltaproteobacteria bacterium]